MHFISTIYQGVIWLGNHLQSIFLLAVRLFWGYSFFQAGSGKLANISGIIEYFQSLGIPYPQINAYLAASTETIGGICLILGLFSRLVSIPLMFTMIVAYATAHHEVLVSIFTDSEAFIAQTPFTFLFASLIIFIFGPGKIALDYLLKIERNHER